MIEVDLKYKIFLIGFAISGIIVGISYQLWISYLIAGDSALFDFSAFILYNLEYPQIIIIGYWLINTVGFIMILSMIFTLWVIYSNRSDTLWRALQTQIFIAFVALVVGSAGIYFIERISNERETIFSESDAKANTTVRDVFSDLSVALYTACCEERGLLSTESFTVAECEIDPSSLDVFSGTSCYLSASRYNSFRKLGTEEICSLLEESYIDIEKITIPNTNIRYNYLTKGINKIPIVGVNAHPTYGCATGKPLAFKFNLYLWFYQYSIPIAFSICIIGSLQLILIIFGICCLAQGKDSDLEYTHYATSYQQYNTTSLNFDKHQV